MTSKQLGKARQSVEIEYETDIALALAKRQRGHESLDIAAQLLHRQLENARAYGAVTTAVKNAIDRFHGVFTKHDIIDALGYSVVANTLDSCLLRLVEKGKIQVKEERRGSIPRKYILLYKN